MAILPTECELCPRRCGVVRDGEHRGFCGVTQPRGSVAVARAALHRWEEPSICTGEGSGAVFFSGCPLHCPYCQNLAISTGSKAVTVLDVDGLVERMFDLRDKGACNIDMITATPFIPEVVEAVARARERGFDLPVMWNTSSYETVESIGLLRNTVDIYLADMKYADARLAERFSRCRDYPDVALRAIEAMRASVGEPVFDGDALRRGVIVRHLLLPGHLDDSLAVAELLRRRFGDAVLYSFMGQYTPVVDVPGEPELSASLDPADYDAFLDTIDAMGFVDYFWQQPGAADESFIPDFDDFDGSRG